MRKLVLILAGLALAPAEAAPRSATAVAPSTANAVDHPVTSGILAFDFLSAAQIADVKARTAVIDVTDGLQAGLDAVNRAGGGSLYLPSGRYRLSRPLSLTGKKSTLIVGESRVGTELVQTANAPAVLDSATLSAIDTHNGVESLAIRCAGMALSDAHGISFVYANSNLVRDVYFRGCNHALDMRDQWQTLIDHVDVEGAGPDQSSVGLYGGPPSDPSDLWGNNALIVSNVRLQHLATYGIRMIQPAGSKIINSEVADAGVAGIALCGEALAQPRNPCQFLAMSNVLVDTISGIGIDIEQGSNPNPVTDMQFDNIWIGSTRNYALKVRGGDHLTFRGVHISSAQNGIMIDRSSYITMDSDMKNVNRDNDGSHAILLVDTTNSYARWTVQSPFVLPGYNGLSETGSSLGNQLFGGLALCNVRLLFGNRSDGMKVDKSHCEYQVVGQDVRLQYDLTLATKGASSGPATLAGLPFAARKSDSAAYGSIQPVYAINGFAGSNGPLFAHVPAGGSLAELIGQGGAEGHTLSDRAFTDTSALAGSLSYFKQ